MPAAFPESGCAAVPHSRTADIGCCPRRHMCTRVKHVTLHLGKPVGCCCSLPGQRQVRGGARSAGGAAAAAHLTEALRPAAACNTLHTPCRTRPSPTRGSATAEQSGGSRACVLRSAAAAPLHSHALHHFTERSEVAAAQACRRRHCHRRCRRCYCHRRFEFDAAPDLVAWDCDCEFLCSCYHAHVLLNSQFVAWPGLAAAIAAAVAAVELQASLLPLLLCTVDGLRCDAVVSVLCWIPSCCPALRAPAAAQRIAAHLPHPNSCTPSLAHPAQAPSAP